MDYDDDVTDDFIESIFNSKSSKTIPSSSPKVNNDLKKGDEGRKFRPRPEKTEMTSGPEKADSDPVSKSPESKRKRKEEENPGSNPVNPDLGVESNQPPEPGSNPIPDPSKLSQVAQGGNYRRWDPNEVPTMVKAKPIWLRLLDISQH